MMRIACTLLMNNVSRILTECIAKRVVILHPSPSFNSPKIINMILSMLISSNYLDDGVFGAWRSSQRGGATGWRTQPSKELNLSTVKTHR